MPACRDTRDAERARSSSALRTVALRPVPAQLGQGRGLGPGFEGIRGIGIAGCRTLRHAVQDAPDQDELKLDLALALLRTGAATEAEQLLDALPANLATDDRSIRARARLGFAALLKDAPPVPVLEQAIAANQGDLKARHLLAVHQLVGGDAAAGLEQLIEMLRRDRGYEDGLAKKALIDAFRVVEDEDLVGQYRRKMASLLF